MDNDEFDERFAQVASDPRFRIAKKNQRKVKIDDRFKSMFDNSKFKLKYVMDKRGRSTQHATDEDLKKFYEISSESSDDEVSEEENSVNEELEDKSNLKVRDARGNYSESTSSSSSDDSESEEEQEDEIDHKWAEWDRDVPQIENATHRIAICNLNWDHIKAVDLFVLLNSFKPSSGTVNSVRIYPSQYGLERMDFENKNGPTELIRVNEQEKNSSKTSELNDEEFDDEEKACKTPRIRERLRQYELNKFKYFYAIVDCGSELTAQALYDELDGMEFESSASTLDLRFIPDDMTFEDDGIKPQSECYSMPDMAAYKAPLFITGALQQSNIKLTWDETDPLRKEKLQKAFDKSNNDDLNVFLASSSDSESDNAEIANLEEAAEKIQSSTSETNKDRINKYKSLLQSLEEEKEDEKGVDMEVAWEPNLKDIAEEKIRSKDESLSVFESSYLKKRAKKKYGEYYKTIDSEEEIQKEEIQRNEKKKKKKGKNLNDNEPNDPSLDLLLMDTNENEVKKKHFNYEEIVKDKNSKRQNKFKSNTDSFKVNSVCNSLKEK